MTYSHHWTPPPRPPRPPWYRDYPEPGVPDGQMRVSDLERTEITNALCRHYGDGRLDEAEFNDRTAKATSAKTRDDLAGLLDDLPPLGAGHPPGNGRGHAVDVAPRPHRRIPTLFLVVVVAIVIASTVPFTFVAWHAHWLLIAIVALYLLHRREHRRRVQV
jgi:hypothetical protein